MYTGQCQELLVQLNLPSVDNLSAHVWKNPLVAPHIGGYRRESERYAVKARPTCLRLFLQATLWLRPLALESAGRRSATKMAITAMTASSSISVNPFVSGPCSASGRCGALTQLNS